MGGWTQSTELGNSWTAQPVESAEIQSVQLQRLVEVNLPIPIPSDGT